MNLDIVFYKKSKMKQLAPITDLIQTMVDAKDCLELSCQQISKQSHSLTEFNPETHQLQFLPDGIKMSNVSYACFPGIVK